MLLELSSLPGWKEFLVSDPLGPRVYVALLRDAIRLAETSVRRCIDGSCAFLPDYYVRSHLLFCMEITALDSECLFRLQRTLHDQFRALLVCLPLLLNTLAAYDTLPARPPQAFKHETSKLAEHLSGLNAQYEGETALICNKDGSFTPIGEAISSALIHLETITRTLVESDPSIARALLACKEVAVP